MNLIDYLVVAAISIGTLLGFFRGLLRSVANLVILYLVTVVAAFAYPVFAQWLFYLFPKASLQLRQAAGFLFILLMLYTTIYITLRPSLIERERLIPGIIDRLGGVVVGFFLTSVWIGLAFLWWDFLLSISWVNWEPLRYTIAWLFATSAFGGLFRGILPYALMTLSPWFAPFGGLPDLFIIR